MLCVKCERDQNAIKQGRSQKSIMDNNTIQFSIFDPNKILITKIPYLATAIFTANAQQKS